MAGYGPQCRRPQSSVWQRSAEVRTCSSSRRIVEADPEPTCGDVPSCKRSTEQPRLQALGDRTKFWGCGGLVPGPGFFRCRRCWRPDQDAGSVAMLSHCMHRNVFSLGKPPTRGSAATNFMSAPHRSQLRAGASASSVSIPPRVAPLQPQWIARDQTGRAMPVMIRPSSVEKSRPADAWGLGSAERLRGALIYQRHD
jgi:hypothetical protein